MNNSMFLVKSLLIIVVLFISLYYDVKEYKIKNFITYPSALVGIILNIVEQGPNGLLFSLKGWLVPVLVLFVFYSANIMGAGDVKLFAAIGAIMGLSFVAYSFIFSVYIGALIALGILIKRKIFLERMQYLIHYLKFIFITRKITVYSGKNEMHSKFIFTTAIFPGTLVQLFITIMHINGVTVFGREIIWF